MLFLRGLYWRRGFAAAVLVVGLCGAAVAAIGPLYARAAGESTLTDALRDAGYRTGLAFSLPAHTGDPQAVEQADRSVRDAARVPGYGAAIRAQNLLTTVSDARTSFTPIATTAWRSGVCAHLQMVRGHCPQATGEAMVDIESVQSGPRWRVGDTLTVHQAIQLSGPDAGTFRNGPVVAQVRIVGAYRPHDVYEPYWFDQQYFVNRLGRGGSVAITNGADAVFVSPTQFAAAPAQVADSVSIEIPLVARSVHLDDLPALRRNVARLTRRFPRTAAGRARPTLRTELDAALAVAAREQRQVRQATTVVVFELAALSLLVLFQVVRGAVAARRDEIALAKLRGLRPARVVAFALGEPVALLAVGAPLGFAVGYAVTFLLTRTALVPGTPIVLTAGTGWAVAAAFAGSAVAAVLAAVQTVTRPVLEQWRDTGAARRNPIALLVLDLAVAALAVVTVIGMRAGHRPRPVFLLAPTLLILAVALVGVRLLPRLGRRGLGRTRASRHIAAFLALRQTVRRPAGLRLAALLTVAAGLATFALCGEAVAHANRAARAQTELGAPTQLSVQDETGHDPQAAVAAADPDGRWAMTTATWSPDGSPTAASTVAGTVLAVEPGRLATTAYRVRGQVAPSVLARTITASTAPVARFRGTGLVVELTTTALHGDHPTVRLIVRRGHGTAQQYPTGPLGLGRLAYGARLDCRTGCTFAGIAFTRTADAADLVTGTTTLTAVSAEGTGMRVAADLAHASSWRSDEVGYGSTLHAAPGVDGLRVAFRSTGGSSPVLDYADTPSVLPLAAAPQSVTGGSGMVSDFSGAALPFRVVRYVQPLPVQLDAGALADLDYLRARLPDFDRESTWTVWLGPHAPPDAVTRLERAGLLVQGHSTARARAAELGRQGPALGLLLLLVCAVAAAVLAVGGTAVSLLAEARRRAFELAALRVVGVAHRTLRRSATLEQGLLLGVAVVLGVPAGYVAAAVALPVVPEFSDLTPVVLHYRPPVVLTLLCGAAFALVLWSTAVVSGRALVRGAVPARLRESAR